MDIKAVIFDLDGVIVTTDNYHYIAWKKIADDEGIFFDKNINEQLRGVSRLESLNIILKNSSKQYTDEEKNYLAEAKNSYYKTLIKSLTPNDIFDGVISLITDLKLLGIKVAIGSSSKNTMDILSYIGLEDEFEAIVDGNKITHSKPNPEVFLKAALELGINPEDCLVVEDAEAGVEAALLANMKVLAVGFASNTQKNATIRRNSLNEITIKEILNF